MSLSSAKGERLSTLDYVFTILSNANTALDFSLVFHLPKPPSVEALQLGARSARNNYPVTSSFVYRGRWEYTATCGIEIEQATTDNKQTTIEKFIDTPFDLRVETPCRQLLLTDVSGSAVLVTRFHHAAADGLSAAMWLGHQLRVAYGLEQPVITPTFHERARLRHVSTSVRRSKFAYAGPSDPLTSTSKQRSGKRRWVTFDFEAKRLRRACRRVSGITYNDLLAACALEVFTNWNHVHNGPNTQQIGLWLPMNIRREVSTGFGNGTSRVRVYPRYSRNASLVDKAREVRRQISWCTEHGEWVVPEIPLLRDLPRWAMAPLLSGYLNRRSVDMATGVFSHADSWAGGAGEVFHVADRIECIGLLHRRHSVAINGTTHRGTTYLTLTYDSGLLSAVEAWELTALYQEQIELARRELFHAGTD